MMNTWRTFLNLPRFPLLLIGPFLLWHCTNPTVFEPNGNCRTENAASFQHPDWQNVLMRAGGSDATACLQVTWGETAPESQGNTLLVHMRKNTLYGRSDDTSWNAPIHLSLPQTADNKKLRFRLFYFTQNTPEAIAETSCNTKMKSAAYECFSPDNADCLIYIEFRPNTKDYSTFDIQNQPDPRKLCHIFSRTPYTPENPTADAAPDATPERIPENAEGTEPNADSSQDAGESTPELSPPEEKPTPDQTPEQPPEPQPEPPPTECKAGETQACYTGPSDTRKVGLCQDGTQACQPDGKWGACTNDIKPTVETCDNKDNNCDGLIDNGCTFLTAGGTLSGKDFGTAAAFDANGDIVVTGQIGGKAAQFGTISSPVQGGGSYDTFVAKIGKDGTWKKAQRVKAQNNPINDIGNAIAVDWNGNVFIVGQFGGTLQFGNSTVVSALNPVDQTPSADGYISVLDANLNWLSASRLGGAGRDFVSDVVVDPTRKRIFAVGTIISNTNITPADKSFSYGTTTKSLSSQGEVAYFVAELEYQTGTGLQWKWVELVAQWKSGSYAFNDPKIALGPNGELYLAMQFPGQSGIDIGGKSYTINGNFNAVVAKLTPSATGASVDWVLQPQSFPGGRVSPSALIVLPTPTGTNPKIALVGQAKNNLTLTPQLQYLSFDLDGFVALIEDKKTSGEWLWGSVSNTGAESAIAGLAANAQGEIFVGAYLRSIQTGKTPQWGGLPISGASSCEFPNNCPVMAKMDPQGKWLWAIGGEGTHSSFVGAINSILLDGTDIYAIGTTPSDQNAFASQMITRSAPNYGSVFVGKNVHIPLKLP